MPIARTLQTSRSMLSPCDPTPHQCPASDFVVHGEVDAVSPDPERHIPGVKYSIADTHGPGRRDELVSLLEWTMQYSASELSLPPPDIGLGYCQCSYRWNPNGALRSTTDMLFYVVSLFHAQRPRINTTACATLKRSQYTLWRVGSPGLWGQHSDLCCSVLVRHSVRISHTFPHVSGNLVRSHALHTVTYICFTHATTRPARMIVAHGPWNWRICSDSRGWSLTGNTAARLRESRGAEPSQVLREARLETQPGPSLHEFPFRQESEVRRRTK
ncbi:hypothetical protein C8T65DRAFT_203492 [Cerioporus squamosus]|nr:hypothetical protein C8T65DRAFT_203492 [Cerioporus squamosus]